MPKKMITKPTSNAPYRVKIDSPVKQPVPVKSIPDPHVYEVFRHLYEMVPFNSPAKRRHLLLFLKEYGKLNSTEKAEFDQFLKFGNGSRKPVVR